MQFTADEALARWQVNVVSSVLHISPEEAKANLNLANHFSDQHRERLQSLARKHGLPRRTCQPRNYGQPFADDGLRSQAQP